MATGAVLAWTYTLRWALLHQPCPGPRVLAREQVAAGEPCPEAVTAQWRAGGGYAVCLDFDQAPMRRWSPERKAAARQRRLAARVVRTAPLFADELIARAGGEARVLRCSRHRGSAGLIRPEILRQLCRRWFPANHFF